MSAILKNKTESSDIDKNILAINDLQKFLVNWDEDYQKKYQV
ncbi:MAG: hypothetical protein RLY40_1431 [Pseudomonadota bacterium]|jgi:hypothetical protein